MKTKFILLTSLLGAALLAGTSALAAGPRGGGNGGGRGPCPPTPACDGSGRAASNRGNPNATGTPLRDGSGKASAPGKGAKDGTGNRAACPVGPRR